MMVTVIGRGHSGTRAMSHTLTASGVYMGEPLNESGDLIPPESMYEACRIMAKYVSYKGGLEWDFSRLFTMDIDPAFTRLIEDFLCSVLNSAHDNKGWKIPETTLVYPWISRLFPDIYYIHWIRDPRDCILNSHFTDNLHDFNIDYPDLNNEDIRLLRAYSWKYQREIMNATPDPVHVIRIRFEDMVLDQNNTLNKISSFLGIPMERIEMRADSVGRWKTDDGVHMYDFFQNDMNEYHYALE